MSIDINSVIIEGDTELLKNIQTLFNTPVGTVPFDREFGIDWSIIDLPLEKAKAKLTIEYINKIKKYIPEVKIKQITFNANNINGSLIPKVVIEHV